MKRSSAKYIKCQNHINLLVLIVMKMTVLGKKALNVTLLTVGVMVLPSVA